MTIYTRGELLKLVKSGRIKIKPFNKDLVGEASIDFTLGNKMRIFKSGKTTIDATKNYKEYTKAIDISESYILKPREFIHGITHEVVELPSNIAGWIQGKSSLARIGLMVHITASLMHPGSKGRQVLEIVNLSPRKIKLIVGMPICQIVFEDTHGRATHKGIFQSQMLP